MNTKGLTIYRSSAGSGKTFTLVLNYLKLIIQDENPFKFQEILAITFTNKAANEMKQRVLAHLKELADNPASEILPVYSKELQLSEETIAKIAKDRLSIMLHNYSDIAIITIDRFAHRLIRSFSRDLDLQADFEIEMDFPKVLQEAVDGLMQQVGNRKDLTDLIVHYAKDLAFEDKSWKASRKLFEIGKLIKKEDTEEWIDKFREMNIEEIFSIHKQTAITSNQLKRSLSELGTSTINTIGDADIMDWVIRGESGWPAFFKKLSDDNSEVLQNPGKSIVNAIEDGKWLKKNPPIEIQSKLEEIQDTITENYDASLQIGQKLIRQKIIRENIIGLGLIKELSAILEQYKLNNNLVLISDFNKTISDIVLQQPTPFIYERIGCKFKHFFIDEFQDTSVQQWQNFIPLIDDSLAQGNHNLLVGDAKQAIYRFRNGEAKQFVLLPEIYKKNNLEVLHHAERNFKYHAHVEELNQNYRSAPAVVNFNNDIFEFIHGQMPASIQNNYDEYKQHAHHNLDGLVEVQLADLKTNKERFEFEAEATLTAINQCLEDGFNESDITILVRQNNYGKEIADYLISQNVPVTSDDSIYLLNDRKVIVILSLLKVLDNIHTRGDVMKLIAYFFPLEQTKRAHSAKLKTAKDLGKAAVLNMLNERFQVNAGNFDNDPLYVRARRIISSLFDPSEHDQFLDSILENIHQFCSSKGEDINQFIDWIEEKNPAIESKESGNGIQIMSIHKSKGLEFNVVILYNCAWELGPSSRSKVWTSIENGDSLINVQIHPSEKTFTRLDKRTEFEAAYAQEYLDGLNLFYVAATRPKYRLYIFAGKTKQNVVSGMIQKFLDGKEKVELPLKWSFGKRTKIHLHRETQKLHEYTYTPNPAFQLEISSKRGMDQSLMPSDIKWGELYHRALEEVSSEQQIKPYLQKMIELGKLPESKKSLFEEQLTKTLTHPELKEWFSGKHTQIIEREIVDFDGNTYRPDRVITLPNETIILDFKTGTPRKQDEQQIKKYHNLLVDLGYLHIKNYLFYVRNGDLVKV